MAGYGGARRVPGDPMKGWTPRQIESLKRMWIEGYEVSVIMERFGKSHDKIRHLVARLGLKSRATGPVGMR